MARKRKPDNESEQEKEKRLKFERVSNVATRSEKTSWNRKMDNMVKLLSKVQPIEDEILKLIMKKIPVLDEIQLLRKLMTDECVHPYEYLIEYNGAIKCKFCERNIRDMSVVTDEIVK